jgi:subtilisin family serine protease
MNRTRAKIITEASILLIAFALSSTVMLLGAHATVVGTPQNTVPYGHSIYSHSVGDGIDAGALDWMKITDACAAHPELGGPPIGISIAIIDSGLDPNVWKYMEDKGANIADYVMFRRTDGYLLGEYHTYKDPRVVDGNGHGTLVASVLWQVAPGATFYILDVQQNSGTDQYNDQAIQAALQWIDNNAQSYHINIVCMSFAAPAGSGALFHDEITHLATVHNVIFVASAGNCQSGGFPECSNLEPAMFSEVISVGAIFDQHDWTLADGTFFRYLSGCTGLRVQQYKVANIPPSMRSSNPWGSVISDYIDFVAPGFDIETLDYSQEGFQDSQSDVLCSAVDGTSFSCPYAAGVIALVVCEYLIAHHSMPSPDKVYECLKQTAETWIYFDGTNYYTWNYTPYPIINGKSDPNDSHGPLWGKYVGWGCVDAYDAIQYAMQH